jgi:hypothetical protein
MKKLLLTSLAVTAFFVGLWVCHAAEEDTLVVPIQVSPSTLNLESQGTWVTIHAEIPYSWVVGVSVTLNGLPVDVTKADNRGELVAKFNLDDVKDMVSPGIVELTLLGVTKDGETFTGSEDVTVVEVSGPGRN